MKSAGLSATVLALLLSLIAVCVQGGFVEPPEPITSQRSLTEGQTRLPCQYQVKDGDKVVQVTWYKDLPDGGKDQIITAHFIDGQTEFGRYSGRVRFENGNPMQNSALIILVTERSDEGSYTCHISTFPSGNFERKITLTIWSLPISSLDPITLVEGQSFRVAATCRAIGHPVPVLSWDTDLPGQDQNRTSENGPVSSYYSLYPLRGMNGKKLDCLVWHPGLEEPRRIRNRLEVQYPPDATITTSSSHWYVGVENAELMCEGRGHPKPQNFTWKWKGGALPDGVSVVGEKLVFQRPIHLSDSGAYECEVKNNVGIGKTEYILSVLECDFPKNNLLLIIICASAGGLVLVLVAVILLVNCHHRRKTDRLKRELDVKNDEINSFSRQASFRRLNSVSTDYRLPGEDYTTLRVDSRIKSSLMSLERTHSVLGSRWGPPEGVELDELGRPVVWSEVRESPGGAEIDREKEEHRKRVESFVKSSSNMSLDSGLPSSLVPLKAQQDDGSGPREPDTGHPREGEDWEAPAHSVAEGHNDDEDGSAYQFSETLANYFDYSNGVLRPKPQSNAILLHPRGQLI
ncbi:nectin-4 isoform X1 [Archocentrus centrarchus]|uniref:nectin-4 isoform X1 n=1 Tax=Archocentrus centrarchus TaxID=63155 RepID=UPI0011E9F882|nr:nectin-4-like isoform X1 [Archocentrus centrarchus]